MQNNIELKAYVDEHTTDKFDLIVCIGGLEFFPDLQDFFSPLSQLLGDFSRVVCVASTSGEVTAECLQRSRSPRIIYTGTN